MAIEFVAEKIFLKEVETAGEVWVARGVHKNILADEIENYEYSLPVWSSRERAEGYLKNKRWEERFSPQAVSLEVFTNAWLSDRMMAIAEIQVNPQGRETRVLALWSDEFKGKVGTA